MNHPSGRHVLDALKALAGRSPWTPCIPVGRPIQALLRPIATRENLIDENDVRALTQWRNRFVNAFLTEFEATEPRTRKWLSHTVAPNGNKILFMLDDNNYQTFGYMGLDCIDWARRYGEADAVVRGRAAPRGIMKLALRTMLQWAMSHLSLRTIGVRVRSDNTAVQFYNKVGFREVDQTPLRRTEEPGLVRWVADPAHQSAQITLVRMMYSEGHNLAAIA